MNRPAIEDNAAEGRATGRTFPAAALVSAKPSDYA
jgi:hypothetical protein